MKRKTLTVMKELRTLRNLILRRPVYTVFYVTKECNFKCPMCGVKDQNMDSKIDISKVRRIAKRLKELGLTVVNIGGGEPLLVKELPEIIKVFKKDFSIRMQTNGYVADEDKIKELARAGLDAVSVSLHSVFPEKQDSFCEVKGAWEKIVQNMILFSKYLPAREGILIMNSVVSTLNIKELPALVRLANKVGFYSCFIPLLYADNENNNYIYRTYAPHLRFKPSDKHLIREMYARLIKMKREGFAIANSTEFLKLSPDFLIDNGMRWSCDAGNMYFALNHNGEFSLCSELLPIGNILDDGFYSRYRDNRLNEKFKRYIANCPNCLHPCFTEISIMRNSLLALFEQALKKVSSRQMRRTTPTFDGVKLFHRKLLSSFDK